MVVWIGTIRYGCKLIRKLFEREQQREKKNYRFETLRWPIIEYSNLINYYYYYCIWKRSEIKDWDKGAVLQSQIG